MKRIFLDHQSRTKLNEKYGAWNVSKATNYRSNSMLAREIRHEAINEYNGKIINL
jgi:hypothetical protein